MSVNTLEALIDNNTRALIIGSMPETAALETGQHFADPTNRFWDFLYEAFGEKYSSQTYEERVKFLLSHHLGVWNVVETCEREGEADDNIKQVHPAKFPKLWDSFPQLEAYIFNGERAYIIFTRYFARYLIAKEVYVLSSTHPQSMTLSFSKNKAKWKETLRLASSFDQTRPDLR